MDFETKVKILKENGFEECGNRRMEQHIDFSRVKEETQKKLKEMSDKCIFLLKYDERFSNDVKPMFYSEEYIRNTDIDKILNPTKIEGFEFSELFDECNEECLCEYVKWIENNELDYKELLCQEEKETALKILNELEGHVIIRAEKVLDFCKDALRYGEFKIKE